MARKAAPALASRVESAWELYTGGQYAALADQKPATESGELRDLVLLAQLEGGEVPLELETADSLFSPLLTSMHAFHRGEAAVAARGLASWLLERDFLCDVIIDRFLESVAAVEEWPLIDAVARKWLGHRPVRSSLSQALLQSLVTRGRYRDAVKLFEAVVELHSRPEAMQRAALAYLQLGQWQQAEALLLPLYQLLSGAAYVDSSERFADIQRLYADAIDNADHNLARENRNRAESLNLGIALLFASRYKDALRVLEALQASAA